MNTKSKVAIGVLGFLVIVGLANLGHEEKPKTELVKAESPTTSSTVLDRRPFSERIKDKQESTTTVPKTTTTTVFTDTPDARASVTACDKFRDVAGKIRNVELTPEEMRKEFKEIKERSIIATPAVQTAATNLVSAGTIFAVEPSSETVQEVKDAGSQMDVACTEAGH